MPRWFSGRKVKDQLSQSGQISNTHTHTHTHPHTHAHTHTHTHTQRLHTHTHTPGQCDSACAVRCATTCARGAQTPQRRALHHRGREGRGGEFLFYFIIIIIIFWGGGLCNPASTPLCLNPPTDSFPLRGVEHVEVLDPRAVDAHELGAEGDVRATAHDAVARVLGGGEGGGVRVKGLERLVSGLW